MITTQQRRGQWSRPFHGVQHLRLTSPDFQVTLTDYGDTVTPFGPSRIVTVYLLCLRSPHLFTSVSEATRYSVDDAQRTGEQWARELGVLDEA